MSHFTRSFVGILVVCALSQHCGPGPKGEAGTSCTVQDNGDGTKTITCEDGTEAVVSDGEAGSYCTVKDNGDGSKTILCEVGTQVVVHDGTSCNVTANDDGTYLLSCEDGTEVVFSDGEDGTS